MWERHRHRHRRRHPIHPIENYWRRKHKNKENEIFPFSFLGYWIGTNAKLIGKQAGRQTVWLENRLLFLSDDITDCIVIYKLFVNLEVFEFCSK